MSKRSTAAMMACARWLEYCLTIGWKKTDLDRLEKLWWDWHDENGNLVEYNDHSRQTKIVP